MKYLNVEFDVENSKKYVGLKAYGGTLGSLFIHGFGDVTFQFFKNGKEGAICYGILESGDIELTNPIWVDFKVFLKRDDLSNPSIHAYL